MIRELIKRIIAPIVLEIMEDRMRCLPDGTTHPYIDKICKKLEKRRELLYLQYHSRVKK